MPSFFSQFFLFNLAHDCHKLVLGNPRGVQGNELDPGYRKPIILLEQSQNRTTLDATYVIPFGVDYKGATTCVFQSTSVEVSTSEQYRNELSKEVKTKISKNNKAFP
jgi:hypothetical protein